MEVREAAGGRIAVGAVEKSSLRQETKREKYAFRLGIYLPFSGPAILQGTSEREVEGSDVK